MIMSQHLNNFNTKMEYLLITAIVIFIGVTIFNFLYNQRQKKDEENLQQKLDMMNQNMSDNLNNVTKNVLQQLNAVTNQVNERLKENTTVIQREHRSVGDRLDTAAKAVNTVNSRLAKIEESNKRIYEVGKDISSLQELLKAPKLRGGLGELFLSDLLAQIFPKDHFTLQHTFKSGDKVDAVIHVRDGLLIPVDSKFPLENFKKMLEEDDEKSREQFRKLFISDVKKRIDEIATKYILPDEGTFDFALMYVPAENVYYEMIIKNQKNDGNLSAYAFSKKVIPVSPNSFFVYLQTILIGLKGFQIEKKAGDILAHLSRLRGDFEKFGTDFSLVGKHIGHARSSYENSERRFERFTDKLEQVETLSEPSEDKEKLLN
jgi:DNA recombination protein RmuC